MEPMSVLAALFQIPDAAAESHWELRPWTTWTAPAWVLLAGIAISLFMMLRITIIYKRNRRRRINRWNRPTRRPGEPPGNNSAFT